MDLKDYLHYYLGCRAQAAPYGGQPKRQEYGKLAGIGIRDVVNIKFDTWQSIADVSISGVKPILRRLEDMTEEEARDFLKHSIPGAEYITHNEHAVIWQSQGSRADIAFLFGPPAGFHYLLSKGFDLFGLIGAGLAIDIKTTTP